MTVPAEVLKISTRYFHIFEDHFSIDRESMDDYVEFVYRIIEALDNEEQKDYYVNYMDDIDNELIETLSIKEKMILGKTFTSVVGFRGMVKEFMNDPNVLLDFSRKRPSIWMKKEAFRETYEGNRDTLMKFALGFHFARILNKLLKVYLHDIIEGGDYDTENIKYYSLLMSTVYAHIIFKLDNYDKISRRPKFEEMDDWVCVYPIVSEIFKDVVYGIKLT